jgi:hypothetical protein
MVANVLRANGIEPAPERGKRTRWSTFSKAHWKILAASDFFSVEVRTPSVHVAGITRCPNEAWMLQIGRNLVDEHGGVLVSKRYLIIDRDTKYSQRFREFLEEGGTNVIRLPPLSRI